MKPSGRDLGDLVLNQQSARARKESNRGRVNRWIAVCAVGLAVISIPVSLANLATVGDETDLAPAAVTDSPGRGAATQAVEAWLAANPSPLPGGSVLSWNRVSVQTPPEVDDESQEITYTMETHEFTLISGQQLYGAVVSVQADPVTGSVMVGTPSLMPQLPAPQTPQAGPTWFGYEQPTVGSNFDAAIDEWAAAFTSGNPSTLKQNVDDKENDRSYMPLTGVAEVQASIVSTGVPEGTHEEDVTQVIARVELRVVWQSQIDQANAMAEDGAEADVPTIGSAPAITYDVLVTDPFSGAPKVVSWGGPGSGPSLTPYSSGIMGISSVQFATPTPSAPSVAPSPSTGEDPESTTEPSDKPSPSSTDKEDGD